MERTYKLYINFATPDNKGKKSSSTGWVTLMGRFLPLVLNQIDDVPIEIMGQAGDDSPESEADIMLCILSGSFLKDEAALERLERFQQSRKNDQVGPEHRIFKVEKESIPYQEQPVILRSLIGFPLYLHETRAEEDAAIEHYFGYQAEHYYWMNLLDLAYAVQRTIDFIKDPVKFKKLSGKLEKPDAIYLAETGYDLLIQRLIIKRELEAYGYKILPDHTLPEDLEEVKTSIAQDVKQVKFTVHMIGNSPGVIPQGSQKSIIELQYELIAGYTDKAKPTAGTYIKQLLWINPAADSQPEELIRFTDQILRNSEVSKSIEVLESPLEDFKNTLKNILSEQEDQSAGAEVVPSAGVYFIYDKIDEPEAKKILGGLHKGGLLVQVPAFSGDLQSTRKQHIASLVNCSAVVIYANQINSDWVKMKYLDVLKAPGFGRQSQVEKTYIISNNEQVISEPMINNERVILLEPNVKIASRLVNELTT